ncbi:phosphotransferase [Corynebacterium choanae]|uniref:Maltokinase n=1 Tax=Corynebacterium choanae TaxID=1862358 RepID=A0A3G6J7V8_9CORY|nr:phosphotransferase [Corynebacterium choanae]AZA14076.1 Maltokinase [Corynebacterium choanae]
MVDDHTLATRIAAQLPAQRFFGAKSATIHTVEITDRQPGPANTQWVFAQVTAGQQQDMYQLLVDDAGRDVLGDAQWLSDNVATAAELLPPGDPVAVPSTTTATPTPLSTLFDDDWTIRPLGAEQSNTSLLLVHPQTGQPVAMVKFFRKLAPGPNPEVELLTALTAGGCRSSAPLLRYASCTIDSQPTVTAVVQTFVPNAQDGWGLAVSASREGASFDREAFELGKATAEIHQVLAAHFPPQDVPVATVIDRLQQRATRLARQAPQLATILPAVLATYAQLRADTVTEQRIHGDLHLGQTLLNDQGWTIIDFEGEPASDVAQRSKPDVALRDVAGMLRSFDYAAHFPQAAGLTSTCDEQFATQFARRCQEQFLAGYGVASSPLLEALVLDKALYEVAYEANNRPDWVDIPLSAVRNIIGTNQQL